MRRCAWREDWGLSKIGPHVSRSCRVCEVFHGWQTYMVGAPPHALVSVNVSVQGLGWEGGGGHWRRGRGSSVCVLFVTNPAMNVFTTNVASQPDFAGPAVLLLYCTHTVTPSGLKYYTTVH